MKQIFWQNWLRENFELVFLIFWSVLPVFSGISKVRSTWTGDILRQLYEELVNLRPQNCNKTWLSTRKEEDRAFYKLRVTAGNTLSGWFIHQMNGLPSELLIESFLIHQFNLLSQSESFQSSIIPIWFPQTCGLVTKTLYFSSFEVSKFGKFQSWNSKRVNHCNGMQSRAARVTNR